jgi:hypothetical protein
MVSRAQRRGLQEAQFSHQWALCRVMVTLGALEELGPLERSEPPEEKVVLWFGMKARVLKAWSPAVELIMERLSGL